MERRLSHRKPIEHEVVLYYSDVGMLCCKVQDVSMDGAFLKTRQLSIPVGANVEVAFNPVCDKNASRCHSVRFAGHVVRAHDGGIGVNFTKFHSGAYAYLKSLVADTK